MQAGLPFQHGDRLGAAASRHARALRPWRLLLLQQLPEEGDRALQDLSHPLAGEAEVAADESDL